MYKLRPLIEVVEHKLMSLLLPFFIAFLISYVFYPLKKILKKRFNEYVSIFLIILVIVLFILGLCFIIIPLLYNDSKYLIDTFIYLIKSLSLKYGIDLNNYLFDFIKNIDFVSSYNIIISIFITFSLSIYMIIDYEKMVYKIDCFLKNKKYYGFIKSSNDRIKSYIKSLLFISLITFFEYLVIYYLMGNPNYLSLAFLAGLLNIIPYFGGIIFTLVALLTSYSKDCLIKTVISIFICSILDVYVINPLSFKKSNDINPVISILFVLLFSVLFGPIASIFAYPVLIILIEYLKYKFN